MACSSRFGCFESVLEMILENSNSVINDTFVDDLSNFTSRFSFPLIFTLISHCE
jgi:hypothetical protein